MEPIGPVLPAATRTQHTTVASLPAAAQQAISSALG